METIEQTKQRMEMHIRMAFDLWKQCIQSAIGYREPMGDLTFQVDEFTFCVWNVLGQRKEVDSIKPQEDLVVAMAPRRIP